MSGFFRCRNENKKKDTPFPYRIHARSATWISRNSPECSGPVIFPKGQRYLLGSGFFDPPFNSEMSAVLLSLNNTTLEFSISFRNSTIANTAANVSKKLMWTLPSTFCWIKSRGTLVPNSLTCAQFDTAIRHPPIEPPLTDDASVPIKYFTLIVNRISHSTERENKTSQSHQAWRNSMETSPSRMSECNRIYIIGSVYRINLPTAHIRRKFNFPIDFSTILDSSLSSPRLSRTKRKFSTL